MSNEEIALKFFEHMTGMWRSWMLDTAAKLNITGHLSKGPMSAEELAKVTGTHAPTLFRLMRALASFGVFKMDNEQKWHMTPMAEVFAKLRHLTTSLVSQGHTIWAKLEETVKTGEPAFDLVYGESIWNFLNRQTFEYNSENCFNDYNDLFCSRIPEFYDFKQFKHIIDVGGNNGSFIRHLLLSAPNSKGTVFDLPTVVTQAKKNLLASEVKDRVSFVGGSFLESVPSGGDCYTLKSVVCDWSDENVEKMISNIAKVMNENTKLVIVQACIKEDNEPSLAKHYDLLDLVLCGGKERTKAEFEVIIRKCGLRLNRVIKTSLPMESILEVTK